MRNHSAFVFLKLWFQLRILEMTDVYQWKKLNWSSFCPYLIDHLFLNSDFWHSPSGCFRFIPFLVYCCCCFKHVHCFNTPNSTSDAHVTSINCNGIGNLSSLGTWTRGVVPGDTPEVILGFTVVFSSNSWNPQETFASNSKIFTRWQRKFLMTHVACFVFSAKNLPPCAENMET